jgi:hypothetical protein
VNGSRPVRSGSFGAAQLQSPEAASATPAVSPPRKPRRVSASRRAVGTTERPGTAP